MKHKYTFLFLSLLILSGCMSEEDHKGTTISGEVVNPQSPYVIISRNDQVIDTAFLDTKNHFYYQFSKVEDGLYTIKHPYDIYSETQMFYLEKNDSIRLRVNTSDFDNSIMYSGDGAAKNNLLTKIFLDNRNNAKILPQYYRMKPKGFVQKIDSIKRSQLVELDRLNLKYNFSGQFLKLIKSIIDYSNYDFKERYYFLVNKYNPELKSDLSPDFFAYRKHIDLNDRRLQTYYIYQYFLEDYLKNTTSNKCLARSGQNCFDLRSGDNLKQRLTLSDSLFNINSIRSLFFTRYGAQYIVQAQTVDEVDSMINFLNNVDGYNPNKLHEIKELGCVQKRQFVGNISNLHLITSDNEKVQVSSVLSKSTVIFYWSTNYSAHHKRLHQEISVLRKRYPELNFIGINIDSNKNNKWVNSLREFSYVADDEFQLVCPPDQRKFYRNYLNKMVFVDKTGDIIGSDLSINDQNIEEEILGLINR